MKEEVYIVIEKNIYNDGIGTSIYEVYSDYGKAVEECDRLNSESNYIYTVEEWEVL